MTTLLDPAQAPAADLAALYHERWEIEGALAELKTHLRGARVVLRSKTPELVRQEFWGLLLAHLAVRGLMHDPNAIRVVRLVISVPYAEAGLSTKRRRRDALFP